MVSLSSGPTPSGGASEPPLSSKLRQIFLNGVALTIPLLITLMILAFVVNFILQTISPIVEFLSTEFGVGSNISPLVMELLAIATLIVLVFVIGLVAETRSGNGFERVFDTMMARIPGVGSVYTSFNEMTELLLSNDTESFREVKLVEFPQEGSYSIAFVTASAPPSIGESTGHDDVMTLFMPLAPNPVMGGYVIHVPSERVYDVDLSVEEGIRSIVTSGVATGERDSERLDGELLDLKGIRKQARNGVEDIGAWGTQTVDDLSALTGDAAADLRKQARREFAAVHSELDEDEMDEREAVRHYMLNRTHESGTHPETTLSSDESLEKSSEESLEVSPEESLDDSFDTADRTERNRPAEGEGTDGEAAGTESQADGDQS